MSDDTRDKLRAWLREVAAQPETGDFIEVADILRGEDPEAAAKKALPSDAGSVSQIREGQPDDDDSAPASPEPGSEHD